MKGDILVTGAGGLVGRALGKILPDAHLVTHADYDLTNESDVRRMFERILPSRVIHLAAKTGGLIDNMQNPATYMDENVLMNTLMVKYAYHYGVERFIGILSGSAYPDGICYPMDESELLMGSPAKETLSYGMSKRILAIQIDSYNKQYKTQYNYISPCNLFGEFSSKDESKKSFIMELIKKIYDANMNGDDSITLYGHGKSQRQYMYVADFAEIIKIILDRDITDSFNVSTDECISINKMAEIALRATNSGHIKIKYDTIKPDGQYSKVLLTELFKCLIPDFEFTPLESAIRLTYEYYKKQHGC